MELFLNTANPLIILTITAIISLVIIVSRTSEMSWPLIIVIVGVTGYLIYHSVELDKLENGSQEISQIYHCIAFDLIFMLVSFISYLWVDDVVSKKKQIKSYDDSLSWFWNKL